MKFIVPFALLAAAVVTAQDENCEANYIVETCFKSENQKVMDCKIDDYDCLCRASEALATCFNNCPEDPRAETYRGQIIINCNNASVHGTAAKATQTPAADASSTEDSSAEETGDSTSDDTSSDDTADASQSEEESGASATGSGAEESENADSGVGHLARNTAGVLLAVAGAVVAML